MNDIRGMRSGKLVVVEQLGKLNGKDEYVLCQCDCGNKKIIRRGNITSKHTKSCGCTRPHNNYNESDFVGKTFGRLYAQSSFRKNGFLYIHCICCCGNEKDVRSDSLFNGRTISCGCYHIDVVTDLKRKHGMSNKNIYNVWASMIQRCENENDKHFKYYGGRGIKVCPEWHDFEVFYNWAINNGYLENLTLDRINNDGNYEPCNCRWVSKKVQANNTRRNRYIEYNGETHTIAEWSRILNIPYDKLRGRITRGWSIEKALFT